MEELMLQRQQKMNDKAKKNIIYVTNEFLDECCKVDHSTKMFLKRFEVEFSNICQPWS